VPAAAAGVARTIAWWRNEQPSLLGQVAEHLFCMRASQGAAERAWAALSRQVRAARQALPTDPLRRLPCGRGSPCTCAAHSLRRRPLRQAGQQAGFELLAVLRLAWDSFADGGSFVSVLPKQTASAAADDNPLS